MRKRAQDQFPCTAVGWPWLEPLSSCQELTTKSRVPMTQKKIASINGSAISFDSHIQRPRDLCVVLPDVLVIRPLEIPIIYPIFQMGMLDRGIDCLVERKSRKNSDQNLVTLSTVVLPSTTSWCANNPISMLQGTPVCFADVQLLARHRILYLTRAFLVLFVTSPLPAEVQSCERDSHP